MLLRWHLRTVYHIHHLGEDVPQARSALCLYDSVLVFIYLRVFCSAIMKPMNYPSTPIYFFLPYPIALACTFAHVITLRLLSLLSDADMFTLKRRFAALIIWI